MVAYLVVGIFVGSCFTYAEWTSDPVDPMGVLTEDRLRRMAHMSPEEIRRALGVAITIGFLWAVIVWPLTVLHYTKTLHETRERERGAGSGRRPVRAQVVIGLKPLDGVDAGYIEVALDALEPMLTDLHPEIERRADGFVMSMTDGVAMQRLAALMLGYASALTWEIHSVGTPPGDPHPTVTITLGVAPRGALPWRHPRDEWPPEMATEGPDEREREHGREAQTD